MNHNRFWRFKLLFDKYFGARRDPNIFVKNSEVLYPDADLPRNLKIICSELFVQLKISQCPVNVRGVVDSGAPLAQHSCLLLTK